MPLPSRRRFPLLTCTTYPMLMGSSLAAPPGLPAVPCKHHGIVSNSLGMQQTCSCRYGNVAAQFKTFWDATGGLWQAGKLAGKPFGMFTSTASIGGGQVSTITITHEVCSHLLFPMCVLTGNFMLQEVTIANSLPNFVHHGMIYIPVVRDVAELAAHSGRGLAWCLFRLPCRRATPWGLPCSVWTKSVAAVLGAQALMLLETAAASRAHLSWSRPCTRYRKDLC